MSHPIDRRAFMHRAAGASAVVSMSLAGPLTRKVLGANDRVRVGVIGVGRQGTSNMKAFQKHGAEIAAVCDVYAPNLAKGKAEAQGSQEGGEVATHTDFRRLLDDKTIDVVINATPDHWHALPVVMACQAGKDVFVEKPVAVSVEEGKAMLAAARKYQRVVQVGLWQRSNLHFQQAAQIVRQGLLGQVTFVRTWNYSNAFPDGIGSPADSEPPAGLDWDMWLGPAPKVPFNANRFGVGDRWSTFRHFWDYSNGMLGDWAVHLVDIVQWALETPGPVVITAAGQKRAVKDNGDTPDTLQTTFEYPEFVCTYENRQANGNSMFGKGYGIEFHGTEATMFLNRSGFEVFPETRKVRGRRRREGGRARGLDAHGRGGRRALQPRGQHARVHEEPQAARLRHRGRAALVRDVPAGGRGAAHEGADRVRPRQAGARRTEAAPRRSSSAASTAPPGS